mmetsp:Transcript_4879/g.5433  ORF Transcript_4879/g.5433 Transcript_4879/m.5433 type:complete len:294 (-) Transcript_4879:313-1194(-)
MWFEGQRGDSALHIMSLSSLKCKLPSIIRNITILKSKSKSKSNKDNLSENRKEQTMAQQPLTTDDVLALIRANVDPLQTQITTQATQITSLEKQVAILNRDVSSLNKYAGEASIWMERASKQYTHILETTTEGEAIWATEQAILEHYKKEYPELFRGQEKVTRLFRVQQLPLYLIMKNQPVPYTAMPLCWIERFSPKLEYMATPRNNQNHSILPKFSSILSSVIIEVAKECSCEKRRKKSIFEKLLNQRPTAILKRKLEQPGNNAFLLPNPPKRPRLLSLMNPRTANAWGISI